MSSRAQALALQNYRKRLRKRGLTRFEVLGLESDRELIRSLARKLAGEDAAAAEIRAEISQKIDERPSQKGGVWAALRSSPLVGADLNLTRPFEEGRIIDL